MTSMRSANDTALPVSRSHLERLIEDAITALDLLDGDSDLEPSIGGSYNGKYAYDAEGDDCDLELSGDEHEPSLGSFDRMLDQEKSYRQSAGTWFPGHDFEDDRSDSEPSLGSPGGGIGNQERWAQGRDRERDLGPPTATPAPVICLAEKRHDRQAGGEKEKLPAPDDPHDLPELYGVGVEGDCMIPEIYSGSRIAASKSEPHQVGDLVVIWLRPEHVKPGEHKAIVKRLLMPPPPWVRFPYREHPQSELKAMIGLGMNNPAGSSFMVPCTHILAVHRVVGLIPAERAKSPDARYEPFGRPLSGPAAQVLMPKGDAPRRKVAAKRVASRKAVRP